MAVKKAFTPKEYLWTPVSKELPEMSFEVGKK